MFENYILSSCFMVIVLALLAQKVIRSFQPSRNRNMCMLLILTVLVYVVMDGMFAACFLFENVNTVFFQYYCFSFLHCVCTYAIRMACIYPEFCRLRGKKTIADHGSSSSHDSAVYDRTESFYGDTLAY